MLLRFERERERERRDSVHSVTGPKRACFVAVQLIPAISVLRLFWALAVRLHPQVQRPPPVPTPCPRTSPLSAVPKPPPRSHAPSNSPKRPCTTIHREIPHLRPWTLRGTVAARSNERYIWYPNTCAASSPPGERRLMGPFPRADPDNSENPVDSPESVGCRRSYIGGVFRVCHRQAPQLPTDEERDFGSLHLQRTDCGALTAQARKRTPAGASAQ